MALTSSPVQERRQSVRSEFPPRFGINVLGPQRSVSLDGVNVSEGGVCLRLQESLEVRSLVRLQITPESPKPLRRPLTCAGRVAWVIQRLDLRTNPPFLYDIGIEFVDPPVMLRHLLAQRGVRPAAPKSRAVQEKSLESALIRGRHFMPRLERMPNRPQRWHLVVSVGGVPCFSDHFPSERTATAAWAQFKRRQAKR